MIYGKPLVRIFFANHFLPISTYKRNSHGSYTNNKSIMSAFTLRTAVITQIARPAKKMKKKFVAPCTIGWSMSQLVENSSH